MLLQTNVDPHRNPMTQKGENNVTKIFRVSEKKSEIDLISQGAAWHGRHEEQKLMEMRWPGTKISRVSMMIAGLNDVATVALEYLFGLCFGSDMIS